MALYAVTQRDRETNAERVRFLIEFVLKQNFADEGERVWRLQAAMELLDGRRRRK